MVLTTVRLESVIFRVASLTALGTTAVPVKVLLVSTTAWVAGAMTERPTIDDACSAWDDWNELAILFTLVLSVCILSRLLNCANCATKALLSWGLSGSWFFSWVTSSCRNASLPRVWPPEALLMAVPSALVLLVLVVLELEMIESSVALPLDDVDEVLETVIGIAPYH